MRERVPMQIENSCRNFYQKIKDSRECAVKRGFEMLNSTACLYNDGDNLLGRRNQDIETWGTVWKRAVKRWKRMECRAQVKGACLCLEPKCFSFNRKKDSNYGEDVNRLLSFILDNESTNILWIPLFPHTPLSSLCIIKPTDLLKTECALTILLVLLWEEESWTRRIKREDNVKTRRQNAHLQAKERGLEQILPSQFSLALLTPWSWASSLQDCETIHFCCLGHPICGALLQ